MSWRDALNWADASNTLRKKASFRGAKFFIRSSDGSVGRRNVVHQYPLKNEAFIEDLGLDVDQFTIEAYVLQNADNGQDYFAERNELIAALKAEGSGTLEHPFLGTKQVSVLGRATFRESFAPGGIAEFSITFVQSEEIAGPPAPRVVQDVVGDTDKGATEASDKTRDSFAGRYKGATKEVTTSTGATATSNVPADDVTPTVPGFSAEAALSSIDVFNQMLENVILGIHAAGPAQVSQALIAQSESFGAINLTTITGACELAGKAIGMLNGLASLAGYFGDIVVGQIFGPCSGVVRGIVSGPFSLAQVQDDAGAFPLSTFPASTASSPAVLAETFGIGIVRASLRINGFGNAVDLDSPAQFGGTLPVIPITTASRARQSANQVAIINLTRSNALLTAARTAVRVDYGSSDTALTTMEEIVDELDDFLLKLGDEAASTDYDAYDLSIADPDSYEALETFRPIFVKAMISKAANLAELINFEVPQAIGYSSLVLAYEQYNDLDRELEIIRRNVPLVKNPGFLPSGKTLEILNE